MNVMSYKHMSEYGSRFKFPKPGAKHSPLILIVGYNPITCLSIPDSILLLA